MGAPVLSPARLAVRCAALLALATACVEGPGGPGRFGEVRLEPAYRAGYGPGAIGVTLDTASVVAVRHGTAERVLDRRVPYSGGELAHVVDLDTDADSLDVTVELWSGGARLYAGDTAVVVESGTIVDGQRYLLAVAYVGPPVVASVTVSPGSAALKAVGATRAFLAEARDPDGAIVPGTAFTWASTRPGVATVDGAGVATATGEGVATITASSGSASGSASLTVDLPPTVVAVVVTPASMTLQALGATQPHSAAALDSVGNAIPGVTFTWSSSHAAVATVDAASGLATATGHGSTTITATTGAVSGTAALTVSLTTTVASVVVSPASASLAVLGATQQFSAEARDATGHILPGVPFTWSSGDGAVATIDAAGLATAAGHGSTTITATSGSVSGTASLTVMLAATVASVVVSPTTSGLTALGATQQFTAEARDVIGHILPGVPFTWSSSDGAVATIDAAGLATAAGHGSTTITATTGSVSGTAGLTVTLTVAVASVVVSPATASLTVLGATQQFTAEARDATGHILPGVPFTWSNSDGAVATIDASTGLATAAGHGGATITATAGTVSGTATLSVSLTTAVASVVVSPAAATLTTLGAKQQFTAEARDATGHILPGVPFTWSNSDGAVATIDASTGLATAAGHGAATITATAGTVSGTATLSVSLTTAVASVVVSPAAATLTTLGATQQFTAEARDATGHILSGVPFTWSSSDGAVATVDAAGLATAAGQGSTTITATTGSVSGTAGLTVTLTVAVTSVVVSPPTSGLAALGATQQFGAEARDANGQVLAGVPFTWSSSDGAVATIDASTGLATAAGHGGATITATAGTVSGTATLSVSLTTAVASVVVSPATASLTALGATQQFSAEARDAAGHLLPGVPFTWSSSDGAVATINATSALATAMGHGASTITATTGSVSGTASLTVTLTASVAGVVVSPAAATLTTLGATQQFTAEAQDATGRVLPGVPFTWTSSNSAAAAIDAATGLATAAGTGLTTITAMAGSVSGSAGLTVSLPPSVVTVVVTPAEAVINLQPTTGSLENTRQFTAVAYDAAGNVVPGVAFTWTSSDTSVATMNGSGLATAAGAGSAIISAAAGAVTGTARLLVTFRSNDTPPLRP